MGYEWLHQFGVDTEHGLFDIELPPEGVCLSNACLHHHTLGLRRPDGEDVTEVSHGWRRGNDRYIADYLKYPTECAPEWPDIRSGGDIITHDGRFVWTKIGGVPTAEGANIEPIGKLVPEIRDCLSLWRGFPPRPDNRQDRFAKWQQAHPGSGELIPRIAEGLIHNVAPWPDPFTVRPEDDETWEWSSDRCLSAAKPMFNAFTKAPLRDSPSGLVADFLYLAKNPKVVHVWPSGIREGWRFKIRTQDHSWLEGIVWQGSIHTREPGPQLEEHDNSVFSVAGHGCRVWRAAT